MDTLRILLILIIFCSCNQTKKKNNSTDNNIVVPVAPMERIDNNDNLIKEIDSINRIKNYDRNSLLDTINLYDKRFVAEIELTDNTWYIISGRPCENCDANINLYIFPKTPKLLSTESLIKNNDNFSYPGAEYGFMSDSIVYEANTFYGKCLDEFDEVIIWVQRSLNDQGKLVESAYMIELFNDKALPSRPELTQSLLDQIDKFFERGNCLEIGGISRSSEP